MPKGSKVLMADDDAMLLDMYKERLGLAGYVVEAMPNGQELLNKLKEFKPDIILLDIMMPKMNGYQTLAAIKSDPSTKDIPVVMLSALMRDFNKEKAMEGGADDYLIKSEAMPSDVITKVEQVLVKYGKGGGSNSIESSSAEKMPPKVEPEKIANHIETQPQGATSAQAPPITTTAAPAVQAVGPSSPVLETPKKSSLWVWITIIGILVLGGLAYFFLIYR